MMQRRTQQTGFTLLELVVALAISALVALMGASAMSMALDFYQRNAQRSTARESIRAAERILRHKLQDAEAKDFAERMLGEAVKG